MQSKAYSACGSCDCFCLVKGCFTFNSYKDVTWVSGSSGFDAGIGVGIDTPCKVQGQCWQFLASHLLPLLVPAGAEVQSALLSRAG